MKKTQALKMFFSRNPRARNEVNQLVKWDCKKTIRENVSRLGLSNASEASDFRNKYDLEYKRIFGWYTGKKPSSLKVQAYRSLRKDGWTAKAISTLFGVSKQAVCFSARNPRNI